MELIDIQLPVQPDQARLHLGVPSGIEAGPSQHKASFLR